MPLNTSSVIPTPRSRTLIITSSSVRSTESEIWLGFSVNLAALLSRLLITWESLAVSPSTIIGRAGIESISS